MDHFQSLTVNLPDGSTLRRDERNDTVFYLSGKNLSETMENDRAFATLRAESLFPQIALAFISAHHKLFRLKDPLHELKPESVTTDDLGYTHVKFQQVFDTIPILNAEIIVHINRFNQVNRVNGRYVPTPVGLDIHPAISEDQAVARVREETADKAPGDVTYAAEKAVYITKDNDPRLAYRVSVHAGVTDSIIYIIDAHTGDELNKYPTMYNKNH